MPITAFLARWDDINEEANCTGILTGNGASRAIWENFSYGSLFNVATERNTRRPLSEADTRLFHDYRTQNFEQVLWALVTARRVGEIYGQETALYCESYTSIQEALIEAVRSTHIPWNRVTEPNLAALKDCLRGHKYIYSTNYDLLIYWAIMHNDHQGNIKDLFFGDAFNIADTRVGRRDSVVVYLHGGLHLCKSNDGKTIKRTSPNTGNLLDSFGEQNPTFPDATPLFVTEGTSEDKLRSISQSDYLSFAYKLLSEHDGALCIFGHSLSSSDSHLVDAINNSNTQTICVSIRRQDDRQVVQAKAGVFHQFPGKQVKFYDAATHPLGMLVQAQTDI